MNLEHDANRRQRRHGDLISSQQIPSEIRSCLAQGKLGHWFNVFVYVLTSRMEEKVFSYFCVLLLIDLFCPHYLQAGFSHLGDTEEIL